MDTDMVISHNDHDHSNGQLTTCLLHTACKNMAGWWRWALVSPGGVASSRKVGVYASVNLPLHHISPEVLFWHQLTRVVPEKGP